MDNIFEILIYIFIIVSFLSSFFKKKKARQKPEQQKQAEQQKFQETYAETEKEVQEDFQPDFLKELEDFFKVGSDEQPKFVEPKPPMDTDVPKETETEIEKSVKEKERRTLAAAKQTTADPWARKKEEIKRKTSKIDSSIEEQAAKFEKLMQQKGSAASEINKKIKKRLGDPGNLKEYIIISEIIGKPKALRR